MQEQKASCPICEREKPLSPRYPQYVCRSCSDETGDANGRRVTFYNVGVHRCEGQYTDDRRLYPARVCFVRGRPCMASEAHLGGVVIEPLEGWLASEALPPLPLPLMAAYAQLVTTLANVELTPQPQSAVRSAEALQRQLIAAGSALVEHLVRVQPHATPSGRVWLTLTLLALDATQGRALLEKLAGDSTPVVVNTCLVGYRTLGDWACSVSARYAPKPTRRSYWPFWRRAQ